MDTYIDMHAASTALGWCALPQLVRPAPLALPVVLHRDPDSAGMTPSRSLSLLMWEGSLLESLLGLIFRVGRWGMYVLCLRAK